MKFTMRLGATMAGLALGGAAALVAASAASAGGPALGGSHSDRGSYSSNNCGTLVIIKALKLDLSMGRHTSMWDMPDRDDIDELTAEVYSNGDGRADRHVKVGKDRLMGKKMGDGVWGGSHMIGGNKKFWL